MATSLVEFSGSKTSEMLGYTRAISSDVKLLVMVVIGIFVGLFIFEIIVLRLLKK